MIILRIIIKEQFIEDLMKRYEDKYDQDFRNQVEELVSNIDKTNSNLHIARIFDDESGNKEYKIVEIYGGLNGIGDWENYLTDILNLLKLFKNRFKKVWIIELGVDNLDDLWTVYYGIE